MPFTSTTVLPTSTPLVPTASVAASTASTSGTDALGSLLTSVLSDPKVVGGIANGAAGVLGSVENLFGIQTPEQQAAAAAARQAAAAAAQQQSMLIAGGIVAAVLVIAGIGYAVLRRK